MGGLWSSHASRLLAAGCVLLFGCLTTAPLSAQFAGGGFPGGGNQGGLNQNQQGGNVFGGIFIDAEGVVHMGYAAPTSAGLQKKRMQAAAAEHVPSDLHAFSPVRKIALNRLEAACRPFAEAGEPVPVEMEFLAGLQRIDYVFVYPETGDLVIAGPAEGFAPNEAGRVVGLTTARPPLRLDDLLVALRTAKTRDFIGCSIDPVPERLAKMQAYIRLNSRPAPVSIAKSRYHAMVKILGLQNVTIWGVPKDSHFAQVLVEADIRMKRISMALENPRIRGLTSHLAMIRPGGNSMRRWWFTPLYDALYASEDGLAFHFEGPRAQLMSQEEFADAAGRRHDAATTPVTTERFARMFTEKFPELADKVPVFAELQTLIDLAIITTLIEREGLAQRVGWQQEMFLDPQLAKLQSGHVPRQVPSATNYKLAGSRVIGLISGGVTIDAGRVLSNIPRESGSELRLDGLRTEAAPSAANESDVDTSSKNVIRWWWD